MAISELSELVDEHKGLKTWLGTLHRTAGEIGAVPLPTLLGSIGALRAFIATDVLAHLGTPTVKRD